MRHDYGFQAAPHQMPPDRAPISKAPANTNENEDALGVGYVQFQVAKWMHELKVLDQYEGCREFVATVLNELAGGRRQ